MKRLIPVLLIFLIFCFTIGSTVFSADFNIEKQIDELLQQMTLEEKIGQLNQVSGVTDDYKQLLRDGKVGSFLNVRGAKATNELQKIAVEETRLGIPVILGNDVIHGYRTIFPIPLGEASTWNPELLQKAATVAAKEASASGTHWTFAPMVDIARDPRWGRIAEGAGEDPYLGSVLAKSRVMGFQGNNLSDSETIVACPKHYVAYGGAEAGKDYNTVDISLNSLREIYLPAFKAAIEAGAGTIMSAFNDLNGVPTSANFFTLTEILRDEWKFDGFVVSDWNSIGELINHGIAVDLAEAGEKALKAGVDMDMMASSYVNNLKELVEEGRVAPEKIDEAARRVLRIKFRLGLFENPYINPKREKSDILNEENLKVALEVARESIVLLKNDKNLLPIEKNIKSVAVIGPLADNQHDLLGCWKCQGQANDVVTVLEGIKKKVPSAKIKYVKGPEINGNSLKEISRAVKLAKNADIAILVVGESAAMSGEAHCRASLELPGKQLELVKAVYKTRTPVVVVLMNGRPLSFPWIAENVFSILETWQLGVQAGNAIADVLFGDYNPGGKLPVTFPRSVGQVPIYYNHKNTGRPFSADDHFTSKYLEMPVTPLYPFGYGLSYSKFEFSDLQINSDKIKLDEDIVISAVVKNVGKYTGDEVVQLYVQDEVGSITRPVKQLKGFKRITLTPQEKKNVEFKININELGFYNIDMKYIVEPGKFRFWVGSNSVEGLQNEFEIVEK